MKRYLLPAEGNFYKANLHSHTTVSDGAWTPEEAKENYKAQGYSILAYTDHDIMIPHPELADEDFLPFTGFELAVVDPDPALTVFSQKRNCHLCFLAPTMCDTKQVLWHRSRYQWGYKAEYIPLVNYDEESVDLEREYTPEFINKAIAIGRRKGYFITYNHPAWSLESYPEYMAYEGFHALEVANYGSLVTGCLDENLHVLSDMIRAGKLPYAIAADDNHNRHNDSFGGFTMIKAPALTYPDVFSALMNGDFYASEGPLIDELYYEDGRVYVKAREAVSVSYHPDIRRQPCIVHAAEGETSLTASFDVREHENAFFLVVRDAHGKFACTRAYSAKELSAD